MEEIKNLLTAAKATIEEIEMLLTVDRGPIQYKSFNITRTCVRDCLNWSYANSNCDVFKQVPPPEIIVDPAKCPQFCLEIPF